MYGLKIQYFLWNILDPNMASFARFVIVERLCEQSTMGDVNGGATVAR